ncbi:integral membrane protein MviN [Jonquetella anthropi DSM 22815]|uniref:Probable lipid II flippase MurJ n=2 Tax=Dethiosulfovibrionaceae TaxID=3029088 RepID=H0UM11_9BACT|nr:murein biosynthesis integral membrane protein MurJ [Jonquetella anthropi]EHM12553.1 integral membrane protein MviN [Jonquetella anthropi DSM 22815]
MTPHRSGRMVRNALVMMLGTLASRVLGLAREMVTAALFGASAALDAFFVAFTLSNLARQLLAEGALSAAFVPVFSRVLSESGKDRAARLARRASAVLIASCSAVVVLGILLSPALVKVMAPGFSGQQFQLAVALTRRMFPFLLFVSVAALAMGALNSLGSFFVPALAPALSNVVFITLTALLARSLGVEGMVWAVLAGGAAQMVFQVWWLRRKEGLSLLPAVPERSDSDLRRMMALFLPYALGLSLNQLNPVLTRAFGSFLPDGTISALNYANRIIQLPLGLVVVGISQAVLPELSRADGDDAFCGALSDALRFSLFLVLPVTVGGLLLSGESVHLLFVRGAFDRAAWDLTSQVLFWSLLGLPGMACGTVVMRGLYARQRPRDAVLTTGSCVGSLFLFGLLLARPFGARGVALAGSLAFTVSPIVGALLLRRCVPSLGRVNWKRLGGSLVPPAALGCCLAVWKLFLPYDAGWGLAVRCLWLVGCAGSAGAVWCATGLLMKRDEWTMLRSAMIRRKGGKA